MGVLHTRGRRGGVVNEQKTPAYRRVLEELRNLILTGELREGDRIPSVREITARYGVPSGTAARVIAELRAEGLIITRHGAGAFVRRFRTIRRSSPARLAHQHWGEGQDIQQADTEERPRTVNVEVGEVAAAEWIAEALSIPTGEPVVYRSRLIVVEDRPVQRATSYLPVDLARGTPITHTDSGPGGVYARLAEIGQAPATFTEYLRARMPRPEETRELELPEGTPVIEITRHAYTGGGRCIEVNRMILDGSAYLLDYTFTA